MTKEQLKALRYCVDFAHGKNRHVETDAIEEHNTQIKIANSAVIAARNEQKNGYEKARKEFKRIWGEGEVTTEKQRAIEEWLEK